MKVRVYTDYDPVRIMNSFDESRMDEVAQKCRLIGNFIEMDSSEIPKDRTDRDCWVHKNGKVEVDEVKRQAKLAKKAEKESRKNAILAKLKITEQELAELIKG